MCLAIRGAYLMCLFAPLRPRPADHEVENDSIELFQAKCESSALVILKRFLFFVGPVLECLSDSLIDPDSAVSSSKTEHTIYYIGSD